MDPRRVATFLKERERYELEVEAKQEELPSLKASPFTASIEFSLLRSAQLFGKLDRHAHGVTEVSKLTSEKISAYIKSVVTQESGSEVNSRAIERILEDWKMRMTIGVPDSHILFGFGGESYLDWVWYENSRRYKAPGTSTLLQAGTNYSEAQGVQGYGVR